MTQAKLKRLELRNWRNIAYAQIDFASGVNQIVGENAQGKTNLLEALYFALTGRSFRTRFLQDFIGHERQDCFLQLWFSLHEVEQHIRIYLSSGIKGARKIFFNFTPLHSLIELLGIMPCVLMAPEDLEIIHGQPSARRDFLDVHIAQTDPLYVHHVARYNRALKQRNHLLRNKAQNSLEIWEEEMAVSAAYIMHVRHESILRLAPLARNQQKRLSNEIDALELLYTPSFATCDFTEKKLYEELMQIMRHNRSRELLVGHTLTGPHKDEIVFTVNGKEARAFASIGQKSTLALSLRLAQWQELAEHFQSAPITFIDDLGMGLDKVRFNNFFQHIQSNGQIFVSHTSLLQSSDPQLEKNQLLLKIHRGVVESKCDSLMSTSRSTSSGF